MTPSALNRRVSWDGREGTNAPRLRSRWRFSLGSRLAAITSLVLVAVSTTVFIKLTARDRAKLIAAKSSAAAMLTELLAKELSAAIDFDDLDDVLATLNYLRGNPDIVGVAVWPPRASSEPMGTWARPATPALEPPRADEVDGVTASPERLVATRTVLGRRRTQLGRVRVVFTLAPENAAFRTDRWQLFWVTVALTAAAALALGLLARRYVVGPIRRVASAATALADGDLSARVEISTDDEIADLAKAFNVMGEAVRFREERLHKELELAKRIQTSGRRDIRHATVDTKLQLRPGDVMLLYTDGATETRSESGEMFGFDRLWRELERVREEPVSKIQEHLLFAIGGWGIPEDDVTLLVARYVAP